MLMIPNKEFLNKDAFNDWVYNIIDDYSFRYEVYFGGSGSGKSFGAMSKVILKACSNTRNVLVVRKVRDTILTSIYALTIEILEDFLPECGLKYTHNKSELVISISNGSKFIFKGLDNSEKIKSINGITDIVIEEATELFFSDFTQLDLRLRPKELFPQIYIMFNPISKTNWCYKHWFKNTPKNAKIIKTTYKDNKFLSKEYKDTLENLISNNKNYYKIYALGEFATLDKLVFEKYYTFETEDIVDYKEFVGLDFGYVNDPTAIIYGKITSDSIYILGEFVKTGMLNTDIYNKIVELGYNKMKIIADCAERKSIDELRKMGLNIVPSKKGAGSIINDIEFILKHKIYIQKSLKHTLEEFNNYTYKKVDGEYINTPVDKYNHLIDALRYGLQCVTKNISVIKLLKENL